MERKEIPSSAGFTIDHNCNVFDSKGKQQNTYVNGDGYITTSIKRIDGCWVTYGIHRLGAITFLSRTDEQTEVNHRDCDVVNNAISNLEWVTASQNNIHSEIMRTDNLYPTVYGQRNGRSIGIFLNAHSWVAIYYTPENIKNLKDYITVPADI